MALSNDYKYCQIFDLDPRDVRKGPFIVVQASTDEDDPKQIEKLFILRKDGYWVEYMTQAIHHPDARGDLCFETMGEIIALLESLPVEVQVDRVPVDLVRQAAFDWQVIQAGGLLAFIQEEVHRLQKTLPPPRISH